MIDERETIGGGEKHLGGLLLRVAGHLGLFLGGFVLALVAIVLLLALLVELRQPAFLFGRAQILGGEPGARLALLGPVPVRAAAHRGLRARRR